MLAPLSGWFRVEVGVLRTPPCLGRPGYRLCFALDSGIGGDLFSCPAWQVGPGKVMIPGSGVSESAALPDEFQGVFVLTVSLF